MPLNTGVIEGKDALAEKLAVFHDLYDRYEELWGKHILTKGIMGEGEHYPNRIDHFIYENISESENVQNLVNAICERLKKEDYVINESYTTIMTQLLEEKDVIIEDVLYEDIAPYFFPSLYYLLSKNKKIMVITPDEKVNKEALFWITEGLKNVTGIQHLWKISTYINALEENTNPDILIVSPEMLNDKSFLNYLSQFEKIRSLEGIILLQGEKIIPNYAMILHTFNLNLIQLIQKRPQYIVFTDWCEGLEHTVRNIFHSEPKDIDADSSHNQRLFYMVWKKEASREIQQKLLPKLSSRKLEAEATLSIPAISSSIDPVLFLNQSKTTIEESIQELVDHKELLFDIGLDITTIDHLPRTIKIFNKSLTVPVEEFSFLLVRDTKNNLIDTLNSWKGTGRKAAFVHVISPPYLIREYLSDQLDFFIDNPRAIPALAPRLSDTEWSTAYYLLERLTQDYIDENEILDYFEEGDVPKNLSVLEGIHYLFSRAFGDKFNYRENIESQEYTVFSTKKKEFIHSVKYRLPFAIRNRIFPKWYRFVDIQHNGKVIGQCFEGHIYQQYLPGQLHSFNGEQYKIEKINLERGIMEVTYETVFEREYYRPKNVYKINFADDYADRDSKNMRIEKIHAQLQMRKADVEITTEGYFEFEQPLNLKTMKYHSLSEPERQINRKYDNGNVLIIQFKPKHEHEINSAKSIEFTLAFLLNELFVSLFPESYQFIKACTVREDEFYFDGTNVSQRLSSIIPKLFVSDRESLSDTITIYVIEDSPFHLGLLEAVQQHWEQIFDIVDDFLYWLLNEANDSYHYLHFGYESIPAEFALEDTFNFIDGMLQRWKLREARTDYLKKKAAGELVTIHNIEVECVFCGKGISNAQVFRLDDGRIRCNTCHKTAIDQVAQVEPLYERVRQFFQTSYGINLRTDITLSMIPASEIHQLSGLPFTPEESSGRLVGKAIMTENKEMKVIIENGAPKLNTLATLAHELTHIWQYDHLDLNRLTLEEIEGFASWVEIDFMEKIGEKPYANKLRAELLSRDDEYGIGYRLITERLAQFSDRATPFEIYGVTIVS